MMLALGVLSVFQLILLPGLLLMRLFPGKRSFIFQLAFVFTLSLLANYATVLLLVAVGLYLRSVVLVLFAAEALAALWVYRQRLLAVTGGFEKRIRQRVAEGLRFFEDWIKKDLWSASLYVVFGTIAIIGILWVLWVWVANFNTVFQHWDAYASWDRWAEAWAENRFPGDTWEYPQLIPVSYSLAYKFIGTTAVKFFGKSIMPLFALFVVLLPFELGRKFKSYGYMLGAGFAIYTIAYFLGDYIPDGYVDIPVACFSLLAICTLLYAKGEQDRRNLKSLLLLGSLSTAAAAVTKQTGLYVMAFYPIFAYLWVLRGRKGIGLRESFAWLAPQFLLVLLIVVPWYAYMEYRIIYGGNVSNIQYVISDIYEGQTLPERFVAAVQGLQVYAWVFLFAFVSLLVLDARFRQLLILMVFPFSILWAFFLSYEARNLAVAMPLLAVSVGVSIEAWVARLRSSLHQRLRFRLPAYAWVVVSLFLLGAATLAFRDDAIIARQISQQKLIFEPTLNQKLYRYFTSHNGPEKVISSYPVGWLPNLEELWINERFQEFSSFEETLAEYPDVTLLLFHSLQADPAIVQAVQENMEMGVYQLEFTDNSYFLVRIPSR